MKKEDLFDLHLPKWPAMVVKGKKITEEQACQVIIRTSSLDFCSNDKPFEKDLHEVLYGVRATWIDLAENIAYTYKITEDEAYDFIYKKKKEYGILPISFLTNNRILSSSITGPYGWCNWDGSIYSNNYNIGKYPSVEDVYNDWVIIAEAFPFLELKCHLFDKEVSEVDSHPVIEYSVKGGKVKIYKPKSILGYPELDIYKTMFNLIQLSISTYRERGCTIEQFKKALEVTKKSLKSKKSL